MDDQPRLVILPLAELYGPTDAPGLRCLGDTQELLEQVAIAVLYHIIVEGARRSLVRFESDDQRTAILTSESYVVGRLLTERVIVLVAVDFRADRRPGTASSRYGQRERPRSCSDDALPREHRTPLPLPPPTPVQASVRA